MFAKPKNFMSFVAGFLLLAAVHSMASDQDSSTSDQPQYRTWTNHNGKFPTEAVFVEAKGDKVTLKKKDGTPIEIPLERLSDADQQYVKQQTIGKQKPDAIAPAAPKNTAAKPAPQWAIFTNKKTGKIHKGKILDREDNNGTWKYLVEGEDGEKTWIFINQWKITYDKTKEGDDAASEESDGKSNEPNKSADRSTVEINPTGNTESKLMTVVVTGVGIDSDNAKYNAHSNAIEQTVGLLVEAETLVENDKLVREKVLTYTEGDIKESIPLDQWQKDSLFYIRLKVTVAVQKIKERLKKQNVTIREVDGEVFYDNAKRRLENAKNFTEMLANKLKDFGADKMVKSEIVGEPKVVDQDAIFATMSVKVKTEPHMDNWNILKNDLRKLLITGRRSKENSLVAQFENSASSSGFYNFWFGGDTRDRIKRMQGDEHGYWIALLQGYGAGKEKDSLDTQWTIHRVDKLVSPLFDNMEKHKYRLHVMLLDATDTVVADDDRELKISPSHPYFLSSLYHEKPGAFDNYDVYFLSPFLWNYKFASGDYCPSLSDQDFRIKVPLNDLKKIVRVKATIERIQ